MNITQRLDEALADAVDWSRVKNNIGLIRRAASALDEAADRKSTRDVLIMLNRVISAVADVHEQLGQDSKLARQHKEIVAKIASDLDEVGESGLLGLVQRPAALFALKKLRDIRGK
jgi:two-component sensor histidine kinase